MIVSGGAVRRRARVRHGAAQPPEPKGLWRAERTLASANLLSLGYHNMYICIYIYIYICIHIYLYI